MSATQLAAMPGELLVPPNTMDPGWLYGRKIAGNVIVCRLCGKKSSGGINRFKKHIANIKGDIIPCPEASEEDQRIIREHFEAFEKKKKKSEKASRHVSTKKHKNKSSKDAEDPPSPSETNSTEFASLPKVKCSRQHRNTRRSKDDKKLDTDIFESFLEDLWHKISEEKRKSCAYFDSLWFSLYKEEHTKAKVLQWIKNKDVFSRNYTFVPIVCWRHWNLLILCHFGEINRLTTRTPCMLLLDSLLDAEPKRLEPDIRRFVFDIFESEGRTESRKFISNIPLLIPKVPQQRKGDECGSYVLYFIRRFVENAPDNFTLQEYPYFLTEEWFTQDDFDKFNLEIEAFSMNKKKSEAELQVEAAKNSSSSPIDCQIYGGSNIIEID